MNIPRSEHPRPQLIRNEWLNLNGEWTFRFDPGRSGSEAGWQNSHGFEQKIIVPFCPESRLSGVAHTDFIECMWYHRKLRIPAEWTGKKILLHFGGIDYRCEVFLNGQSIGRHAGGVSPFCLDLSGHVQTGNEYDLTVKVIDEPRSHLQAFGKQSPWLKSKGCVYTRTTGIWQTVWLEAVSPLGLKQCRVTPDFDNGAFTFTPRYFSTERGNSLHVRILDGDKAAAEFVTATADGIPFTIKLPCPKAWAPGNPFLYEIEYEVKSADGKMLDAVQSYAGLRKFHIEGDRLFLNNEPIFLRLVLDQGFYPEGIWTAPSDEALKNDIVLSMKAGFNGARLHQKIFEERFHYWADKLGYLTWAEFPDWGMGFWQHFTTEPGNYFQSFRDYYAQWAVLVERDANHPSIVTWTPFNETCGAKDPAEHARFLSDIYDLTKSLDPSRPVNDSSGYVHAKTDLWTVHNYTQSPEELLKQLNAEPVFMNHPDMEKDAYAHQPYLVDEYGGVKYIPEGRSAYADNSWGYGNAPAGMKEALERIRGVTGTIVRHPRIAGYCYTQLTDVEQEQNGVYCYDRTPKFDEKVISGIFSEKPDWSKY